MKHEDEDGKLKKKPKKEKKKANKKSHIQPQTNKQTEKPPQTNSSQITKNTEVRHMLWIENP